LLGDVRDQCRRPDDTGVVDEQVDAAELAEGAFRKRLYFLFARYIGGDGERGHRKSLRVRRGLLQLAKIRPGGNDGMAVLSQRDGDQLAEPAAAAGDNRYLVCQHLRRLAVQLTHVGKLEVRILDDAEEVTERIAHGGDLDAAADILDRLLNDGAQSREPRQLGRGVGNAPKHLHAGGARLRRGDQAQLETAHRETDIERLVEVRVAAQDLTIPLFAAGKVRCGIDCGSQTLDHDATFVRPP